MNAPARKPNLFVVGAMKSATTSLHELLSQHPDIYMSRPKEPMFFMHENPTTSQRQEYSALFRGIDAPYVGESSTTYAMRPRFSGAEIRIHHDIVVPKCQIIGAEWRSVGPS